MDSQPLFTIVTVTLDNLAGLRATSASVLAQQYADFEWWIVDGGSKDGSAEYLSELAGDRIHYVSGRDAGIFDAMNKGLALASGRFIIFMNAGDLFADGQVLQDVALKARSSQAKLIYGDAIESGDGPPTAKRALPHWMVWYSMFTHHQAIFYASDAIAPAGYDLSYRISADWALTARLLASNPQVLRLHRAICIFDRSGVSQSARSADIMEGELRRMHSEVLGLPRPVAGLAIAMRLFMSRMRLKQTRLYRLIRSRW